MPIGRVAKVSSIARKVNTQSHRKIMSTKTATKSTMLTAVKPSHLDNKNRPSYYGPTR